VETYIFYLTVFIGILTFALAAQAIILFFAYRRISRMIEDLEKTVYHLSERSTKLIAQADELIAGIKRHTDRYGQVGDEISTRVQHTVNGILNGVDRIGNLATNGAATVVREARAVMHAVVQAITHFGRRPEQQKLPPPQGHGSPLH